MRNLSKITHLPYQLEEDGRWGLIDWEGNPLIEEEFKHRPSAVIDGMFCVRNSDKKYEFYTAEKKPKQIGDEYLSVGHFADGLAPVVKKDSRITYINKEGKVIIELTKYKDDPIIRAHSFKNGIAIIATASGKEGCINTKGEFVVPPIYKSVSYAGDNILCIQNEKEKVGYINYKGKTLVEPKYSDGYAFDSKGYALVEMDGKHILIDKSGKELFKLNDNMKIIGDCSDDNLIPYCLDNKSYGYLNLKGEKTIKLSANIKNPSSFYNGYAIFRNSDRDYGTINTKGDVVIRAKYDNLKALDGFDFMLFEEENEWGLLSYSGDVIKRASYKDVIPFFKGNKYTYAKDGDEWILIDQKGEDTKKIEVENIYYDIYSYDHGYSYSVESDYFDVDAEVKSILSVLNEDGTIDEMTYDMTPEEFANVYNKDYKVRDLLNVDNVRTFLKPLKNVYIEIGITYYNDIIVANYERKWVSNRWGGYYDDVISGYSYNSNIGTGTLFCEYELKDKFLERKQDVLEAIKKYWNDKGYRGGDECHGTSGSRFYLYEKDRSRLIIQFVKNDVLRLESVRINEEL